MKLCAENQGPGPWFLGGEVESGLGETPTEDRGSAQGDSVCETVHGGVRMQRARQVPRYLCVCRCVCERDVCVCVCLCRYVQDSWQ